MTRLTTTLLFAAMCVPAARMRAQDTPADYRDEFLQHFERSSRKVLALAEAMPSDLYNWRPGPEIMSVVRVYMHITRYNYLYLEQNFGIAPPAGIDVPNLESITARGRVNELLRQSVAHVRETVAAMTPEQLESRSMLYGREVSGWAVLFQLLAHLNEHVGQSVAYARVNGIVPPWSSE